MYMDILQEMDELQVLKSLHASMKALQQMVIVMNKVWYPYFQLQLYFKTCINETFLLCIQ